MSTPTPIIAGPYFRFVRDIEFGLTGTLNRTVGQNTPNEASFHVPTLTLVSTDPQIIAGKVRVPPNYPLPTFQLQKYEFDIVAINDPMAGGASGVVPTPLERPDIWEVWPGTSTFVIKDFWFVDFLQNGNLVLHTSRPGLLDASGLISANSVLKVSRNSGGRPGQWTQVSDLPNGTYEVQVRVNPSLIASEALIFGLTKNSEDVIIYDNAPPQSIVINVFRKP